MAQPRPHSGSLSVISGGRADSAFGGLPPDEYGIHCKSGYRFGIPVADNECGTDKTLQSFPFRIVVILDFQRACRLVQRLLHEFAVGR